MVKLERIYPLNTFGEQVSYNKGEMIMTDFLHELLKNNIIGESITTKGEYYFHNSHNDKHTYTLINDGDWIVFDCEYKIIKNKYFDKLYKIIG